MKFDVMKVEQIIGWPIGNSCMFCGNKVRRFDSVLVHRSQHHGTLAIHKECLVEKVEMAWPETRFETYRREALESGGDPFGLYAKESVA